MLLHYVRRFGIDTTVKPGTSTAGVPPRGPTPNW
jgi:hypothetical protein